MLAVEVKRGQQEEKVAHNEPMLTNEKSLHTLIGTIIPSEEKSEFEDWVKPQIDGMIPVYGRKSIDYISLEEFELIGKTIFAEAKTEEFFGKIAVAEVILNRMESKNFPDSAEEVIKWKDAFSSWGDGSIETAPLDDECLEAVQEAINERFFPDTVVYFREGHFHPFGEPYTVIGNHYFSSEEEKT